MRMFAIVLILCCTAQAKDLSPELREKLLDSVTERREQSWDIARKIWNAAEPGYQEKTSSSLLADLLEDAGLKVQRSVANIPTAFTAEFGVEGPLIGILGEFDALPGLSQEAIPERAPREEGNG